MQEVRVFALSILAVSWLAGCGSGDTAQEAPAGETANSARLEDWRTVGDDAWRFTTEGVAAGPADVKAFLVSPVSYSDFVLTLDYRIAAGTNSGIYIRCTSDTDISPDNCYEINIWDEHAIPASRTGSIVGFVGPAEPVDGLDRWVSIRVEAIGDRIVATFDGVRTADLKNSRSLQGPVALQYAGTGTLEFRDVAIESISSGNH